MEKLAFLSESLCTMRMCVDCGQGGITVTHGAEREGKLRKKVNESRPESQLSERRKYMKWSCMMAKANF